MRGLGIILLVVVLPLVAHAAEAAALRSAPAVAIAPKCVRDGALVQATPALAFGRKVYLAAWSDGSRMLGRETADIYCARVEARTGRSLDPKGVVICKADNLQGRPAVAFDGTNFLVVWQDLRNGADYDIYAARVTEDGRVLDPGGFPVIKRANNQAWPAVAFAAGHYVVAWMDARQYPVYGIYFARVSPARKVLDPQGRPLDIEDAAKIAKVRPTGRRWLGDKHYWWHDLASRTAPVAASNTSTCLVVYTREYPFAGSGRPALAAALVRPADGTVTRRGKVAGGPSPAWTGQGWLLGGPVWKSGWTPRPRLGAGFLAANGQAAPEAAATVDLVDAFGGGYNVGKGSLASFPSSVAFNGRTALVAMQYAWRKKGRDKRPFFAILVARVSTQDRFKVLDAKPLVMASASSPSWVNHPALAAGPNGECLLVYEHDSGIKTCLILARVLRQG